MSDKYKLVSHEGKMVPSGYTDGTLSFKETISYLKAINRISTIDALLFDHVDSVIKGLKVEGSSITAITNKTTNKTWTPPEFSHQLFMSVNRNPDNYDVSYGNNAPQQSFRQQVSKETVERHTKNTSAKVSVLGNGQKSFLIGVTGADGSTDHFTLDGKHYVDPKVLANYVPIDGLEGIDSKEFARKYDEYISQAVKAQNINPEAINENRIRSIFEGIDDNMEKTATLTYTPSDDEDGLEGEISKLFMYASSKGMEGITEKIIDFTEAMKRGEKPILTITDEDLGGKITAESLDGLLTNLAGADLTEFTTYINSVSPRGYGLIYEVSNTLQTSGVGELIRQVVTGATRFRGSKEEIRASESIIRAFGGIESGELTSSTAIGVLAASPKVNAVLDDIFYLAKKTPTKPVFSKARTALASLAEISPFLDVSTKKDILRDALGMTHIRGGEEAIKAAFDTHLSMSKIGKMNDDEAKLLSKAITNNITRGMAPKLLAELSTITPQVMKNGKPNASQVARIEQMSRYIGAVGNFNPNKKSDFAFAQGVDRAIMATMLSMSRADTLDPIVQDAYRSIVTKQEFIKSLSVKTKFGTEAKSLLALTGLRLEKDGDKYRLYDGVFQEGIELTENNLKSTLSRYQTNDENRTASQESRAAWANILGNAIGRDKIKLGSADTRGSVLKFGALAAPLARDVQDSLGFVPGASSTITIPEGMSSADFANHLHGALRSSSHDNVAKMKEYNRVFSSPLIDDYIASQADVVVAKVAALGVPRKGERTVKAGKHIGELLEVSMLLSTTLGVIEHHAGSLDNLGDGELQVLHSPGDGDITGSKLSGLLSTALGKDVYVPDDISALGSVVKHGDKVYVSMKENRDTGAIDAEVMVFGKDGDKLTLDKHQAEFKNSQTKVQTPHLNQYAPHANVEAGVSSSMDTVTINNTVSLNVITPANAAAATSVSVAHVNFHHLPTDTSSTEGLREGGLSGPSSEDVPTSLTPRRFS